MSSAKPQSPTNQGTAQALRGGAASDRELGRLLAGRPEPSVLEKEALFDRVHARTRSPARRWWTWLAYGTSGGAVAAAALWLLLPAGGSEFLARGTNPGEPDLRVVCLDTGQQGVCPSGGRLAFELRAPAFQHVGLFAVRDDGLVIWYFPGPDGTSVSVPDQGQSPLLSRGVRLGESQPAGDYTLIGVFSHEPLTRDRIRASLDDDYQSRGEVVVTRQHLTIIGIAPALPGGAPSIGIAPALRGGAPSESK